MLVRQLEEEVVKTRQHAKETNPEVKAHIEALQMENDHLTREVAILKETTKVTIYFKEKSNLFFQGIVQKYLVIVFPPLQNFYVFLGSRHERMEVGKIKVAFAFLQHQIQFFKSAFFRLYRITTIANLKMHTAISCEKPRKNIKHFLFTHLYIL